MADPDSLPRPSGGSVPLLTEAALENSTGHLREAFREWMQHEGDVLLRATSRYIDRLITEAYMGGVRDGFVKGAEAQARAEGTHIVPASQLDGAVKALELIAQGADEAGQQNEEVSATWAYGIAHDALQQLKVPAHV